VDLPGLGRCQQRTARLLSMTAVAESATAGKGPEFDETIEYLPSVQLRQAELPNARRIDKITTVRQMIEPRGSGCVCAFLPPHRQCANGGVLIGGPLRVAQRIYK